MDTSFDEELSRLHQEFDDYFFGEVSFNEIDTRKFDGYIYNIQNRVNILLEETYEVDIS